MNYQGNIQLNVDFNINPLRIFCVCEREML